MDSRFHGNDKHTQNVIPVKDLQCQAKNNQLNLAQLTTNLPLNKSRLIHNRTYAILSKARYDKALSSFATTAT